MNTEILLAGGICFLPLMALSGIVLMRELRQDDRFAQRVRMVHGQPPAAKRKAEPEAIRAAVMRFMASVGQIILRTGMVSARTLTELQNTLASSGLRGPQGVGVFIGAKIMLVAGLPAITWLVIHDMAMPHMLHTLLPPVAGVLGLLAPDWVVGKQRKRYLAKLGQGLPDALDMMVICTQAGLGLGPAIIRVGAELQYSYREIAIEFEQTANELQVLADARMAITNLGERTGLDTFKRLATTLVQTIHYGTPISDALRVLSSEMRQETMINCEERAARLPVLLTLPTIVFILPCVFLISGGPAIIQVMRTFHP
ncbi:MAG TPA: type II secretion system F family protein [Acetobacteraceae bacterium]|jgi:tight adherence protein C